MHPVPRRRPLSRFVVANPGPAWQPPFVVDDGPVPLQNRGKPWFEDGNVLLVARETAFKVYKGLLGRRSTVFADLFAAPQPADKPAEIIEGCPILRLQDSPTDLTNFLTAVYNEYDRRLRPKSKEDFAILTSTLRMADKYDAQYVRSWVLPSVQVVYPDNLSDLDELWRGNSESIGFTDPVQAVHFARETSALVLLPAAMVRLTSHSFLRGVPLRKLFASERLSTEDLHHLALFGEHDRLTNARIMKVLRSRVKEEAWRTTCDRAGLCADEFLGMFHVLSEILAISEYPVSCIDFAVIVRQVLNGRELCRGCRDNIEGDIVVERQRWWCEVPAVLGFAGWGDTRLLPRIDEGRERLLD